MSAHTATRDTAAARQVRVAGMAADLYGHPDDRPPIVLLPGLTFDRGIWRPILDRLARIDPDRLLLSLDLPGHRESPSQLPHSMQRVTGLIHGAVREAGLDAPVVAGHSMSGGVASVYAAHYPTRGVVNVDAPPDLAPFVRLLQSAEEQIRGDGFAGVWAMLEQSFRTDLLPPQVRGFIGRHSHPRQDVAVSYWDELLARTPEEIAAMVDREFAAVAGTAVPYLLVLGSEPAPDLAERIRNTVPRAAMEVWDGTGHFPHLAYPARFAERLAATAQWREAPAQTGRAGGMRR